jgi:1-acyl-sn-glycerol-3-phosphate acyltransferase
MATAATETRKLVEIDADPRRPHQSRKVHIVATDRKLAEAISACLSSRREGPGAFVEPHGFMSASVVAEEAVVYVPSLGKDGTVPSLGEAGRVMAKSAGVSCFILVSSAAVYGASFRNPGLVRESYPLSNGKSGIASQWKKLEEAARVHFPADGELVILRCAPLLSPDSATSIARGMGRRFAVTLPGHDPSIQLLTASDLAEAVGCILRTEARGVLNVAPDGVIPLREALRRSKATRMPMPRTILRAAHALWSGIGSGRADYARYSWTISNDKIKSLGFRPRKTSAGAIAEILPPQNIVSTSEELESDAGCFDDFGMDKAYIAAYGRTLFRFLADWYWRIEAAGIEHIPRQGRAVLAGVHRGFMPWDGVMALDLIVKNTGRYPRFLIHPGLVKFPFLANFMTKLGGIIACQENAAHVLERDELLGVFPEGIRGAFVRYSKAYQIQDFHRDAFVKIALRHQAPIIPFVTVGSAEIFPILGKLKSRMWSRYSEWPAFPITPTFPLIPLPLPSKWHSLFLPAMHVEREYPPSAAADASVVRTISAAIKQRMQSAIDEILERRRSIFFGSVFPESAP